MVRLTDRQEGWRSRGVTLRRLGFAVLALAAFILANLFFCHPMGGLHFRNVYMARADFVAGMFTIWGVEFAFISLLAWNWQATSKILLHYLGLTIVATFGVAGVVSLFPDLIPVFRLPQALLLTLLMGYLQIVAAAAVPPGSHNSRLGETAPQVVWQRYAGRVIGMLGITVLVVLYGLMGEGQSIATAVAYGLCALMGGICAWLVSLRPASDAADDEQ